MRIEQLKNFTELIVWIYFIAEVYLREATFRKKILFYITNYI